MCSNIPASPAYGVYISQLIRYARASLHNLISNEMLNNVISKPQLLSPYLYTFSILLYENPSFIIVCRDRIFFDKILVSEYKLFKRSNKANLFIALVQSKVWISQSVLNFRSGFARSISLVVRI
jgi:hypothetical protein